MTSSSIGQIILFYIVALPFYLALASFSLRYFVKKNSNSLEQLTNFLNSLPLPLKLLFNVNHLYTFARIQTIKLETYFFNINIRDLLINRIVCLLLSSTFASALLISYLFYHVPIDLINFPVFILHILTIFWASRFGSNIK